jgi:hypothetical protein
MLGFPHLMLDLRLDVSLFPENPVANHLGQGFLWRLLGARAKVPKFNFALHVGQKFFKTHPF